jgi:hypothetical protein
MTAVVTHATTEVLAARIEQAAYMAYLDGASEVEIGIVLGIKPVTVRDWKKRPEWSDAVVRLRDHQHGLVLDRLALLSNKATDAIEESLGCKNPSVRLKAAQWVLERNMELGIEGSSGFAKGHDVGGDIERFLKLVAANEHPPK